ncbi:17761_t:CDS:2, partial [Acaulospora morrowiae]
RDGVNSDVFLVTLIKDHKRRSLMELRSSGITLLFLSVKETSLTY